MCWNEHVSLNTFVFGIFMVGMMMYNNSFTPYNLPEVNVFYYFFMVSFISMQLIEFFLWRNINNVISNRFWSNVAQLLVTVQPAASLLMLSENTLKLPLLAAYAIFVLIMYNKYGGKNLNTKVLHGHLQWNWANLNWVEYLIWVAFLMFSLVYNKHYKSVAVGLILFCISYYSYDKERTAGSLWCWSISVSMLIYAVYILIVAPFKEHGIFC